MPKERTVPLQGTTVILARTTHDVHEWQPHSGGQFGKKDVIALGLGLYYGSTWMEALHYWHLTR